MNTDVKAKVFLAGNQVCMKRGMDVERLQRYFKANGCELVDTPEVADIVVAMTCAFIGSYVRTAVQMIESLKKTPARLIVLGCLPSMASEELKEVFTGPTLTTKDFDRMDELFPGFTVPWNSIADSNFPDVSSMQSFDPEGPCPIYIRNSVASGKRPGPFIRIAWGCRNNCSYCSHPAALGTLKSKPLATCLDEYKALLAAGHKRITLHANDPAAYGLDIGLTYPALLNTLEEATGDATVRWALNDINPAQLVRFCDDLLPFIASGRVQSLAVPIQSGSPALLRRMRRFSQVEAVVTAMKKIREAGPDVSLVTHLIAGFPGETLDDVDQTVDVVRRSGFNRAMVFPFSANPDTPAEKMERQLPRTEIKQRQYVLCERLAAIGIAVDRFQ